MFRARPAPASPFRSDRMNGALLFSDWLSLARILIVGPAAYLLLVAMLRVSGKRTLSKLNAFDLIITVALGSTLATIVVDGTVPLADGILALLVLIALQYVVSLLSTHSHRVRSLVKGEPTLLVRDGSYLAEAMAQQRVTREEIEAALRSKGVLSIRHAAFVVLETDGSLSVVDRPLPQAPASTAEVDPPSPP